MLECVHRALDLRTNLVRDSATRWRVASPPHNCSHASLHRMQYVYTHSENLIPKDMWCTTLHMLYFPTHKIVNKLLQRFIMRIYKFKFSKATCSSFSLTFCIILSYTYLLNKNCIKPLILKNNAEVSYFTRPLLSYP